MFDKIIISIGTLGSGGAERVVSEISAFYCDYFQDVIVLTWIEHQVFYDLDSRVRFVCVQRECGSASRLKQAFWVRGFVKKECPKVFLSFLMPFNMLSIVTLAFTNTRVIVCERQDPSVVKTPILRVLRKILYHFSDRIEVQTKEGKQYFNKSLNRKIFVIPNPNHITTEQRLIAMSSAKGDRIVTIGRLILSKNHYLLIDVFAKIHQKFPNYRLEIYGEGEMYDILQNKIEKMGLSNCALLCGTTNDVVDTLSTARIFVLSSNVEGMPNALMEAMALGLPCVSTDVSGVRDIIDDGENGYVVPKGDVDTMVDRINELIESEEKRHHFAEATISVIKNYDKGKILNQWLELVSF